MRQGRAGTLMLQFAFRWTTPYRVLAAPFLITPRTAYVRVVGDELTIRFGPWSMRTPLDNVAALEVTGDYSLLKTAGPPRLSLADGGITFATNGEAGLCIQFAVAVPAIEPSGWLRHAGATVTVDDVAGLRRALER